MLHGKCGMNNYFWRGKKVFVTGHTGFKGSWLVQVLDCLGAEVTGYSLPAPTKPSLFEQIDLSRKVNHIIGDIRDTDKLTEAMRANHSEVIFHLAAQPLVSEGYNDPIETFSTNVMGTQSVLEAIRQCETVQAAVMVSSDKCYQNREQLWGYKENDPLGGNDPYSASKGCMELLVNSYQYSFFSNLDAPNIATARAGNVIGGGDWAPNRLVPDILKALSQNEVIKLRSPNATRPWQHVLEPLFGYLTLAERLYCPKDGKNFKGSWNFGPEYKAIKSVIEITEELKNISGSTSEIEYLSGQTFKEAKLLNVDSTKAHQQLNWHSVWSINEALELTWRWQQGFKLNMNTSQLCQSDIELYLAKLAEVI